MSLLLLCVHLNLFKSLKVLLVVWHEQTEMATSTGSGNYVQFKLSSPAYIIAYFITQNKQHYSHSSYRANRQGISCLWSLGQFDMEWNVSGLKLFKDQTNEALKIKHFKYIKTNGTICSWWGSKKFLQMWTMKTL